MKIYLSGSMSHNPSHAIDFLNARRRIEAAGHTVFDPTDSPPNLTHTEYMRLDLAQLPLCDAICYVNDISESKGAFIEQIVAAVCGIPEYNLEKNTLQNGQIMNQSGVEG